MISVWYFQNNLEDSATGRKYISVYDLFLLICFPRSISKGLISMD